jgi:hypothetical protein
MSFILSGFAPGKDREYISIAILDIISALDRIAHNKIKDEPIDKPTAKIITDPK